LTIASMTGFGHARDEEGGAHWSWDIKSVNGRGFECRFRLPPGFDNMEVDLKRALSLKCARGNFFVALSFDQAGSESAIRINEGALDAVLDAIRRVSERIECGRPQPEAILAIRGVLQSDDWSSDEERRERIEPALRQSFEDAVERLAASRRSEGLALETMLSAQIAEVEQLRRDAAQCAAAAPSAIKARIAAQISDLLGGGFDAERLEQEAALIAMRADIREELDRLDAHCNAARSLLKEGGPVGRKLDFLSQEFNREANTLCSKAADLDLKRIGLAMKSVIDQFREQVQNIE
jgi:uncharacterized protein (TIGR00255 family)